MAKRVSRAGVNSAPVTDTRAAAPGLVPGLTLEP